jgi:hypothetical protein
MRVRPVPYRLRQDFHDKRAVDSGARNAALGCGQVEMAIVRTGGDAKTTLRERGIRELKKFVFLFLYLYVTLGAVILVKTAVLHTQGIEFTPWGIAIVKAAVLAKFMMLGDALKIGARSSDAPLIWPTLRKSFAFLVLLILMTIVEEAVVGLLHHRPVAASLGELVSQRLEESIAGIVIVLLVLIPYFAFRVLDEALGKGRLTRMFFVEREPIEER